MLDISVVTINPTSRDIRVSRRDTRLVDRNRDVRTNLANELSTRAEQVLLTEGLILTHFLKTSVRRCEQNRIIIIDNTRVNETETLVGGVQVRNRSGLEGNESNPYRENLVLIEEVRELSETWKILEHELIGVRMVGYIGRGIGSRVENQPVRCIG